MTRKLGPVGLEREERRRAELLEKAKKQRAKTRWSKTASKKAAIIDHDRTRIKAAVRAPRQKTTYIWNESLENKQEAKPPPPPEEKEPRQRSTLLHRSRRRSESVQSPRRGAARRHS